MIKNLNEILIFFECYDCTMDVSNQIPKEINFNKKCVKKQQACEILFIKADDYNREFAVFQKEFIPLKNQFIS